MDLPVVEHSKQNRPSLKADPISKLIRGSKGQEQALHLLLAATGMRISEALALETHFINKGRTIVVEQQVKKDVPRIILHLKTNAAKREIDLHSDIAEYLREYITGKMGLLFHTANGTPYLHNKLEGRWLTPRLIEMGLGTKKEWAGTHSRDSAKHGCVDNAVWRASIISGWRIVRKVCPSSTHIFTRNCNYDSMNLSEWATDSLFRCPKTLLLYRLSRNRSKKMDKKLQRKYRRMLAAL